MPLATLTLDLINQKLEVDQGATFRGFLGELIPTAGDAYSTKEDPYRDHLGASLIGKECARELWYSFRWFSQQQFEGRILRLFNRGHLEEPRFVALLKMIGCQVWQFTEDGKQFRIHGHNGHFGGSLDAVILGIPEMPDEPVLGEFKTHSSKSFEKLKADGVLKAKWEHFIQMQIYMGKMNLRWALYLAVNKNDDDIYGELIQFDQLQYQRYLDRSISIVDSRTPPPRINENPSWFKCKFCNVREICHEKAEPAKNCRTCKWSSPTINSEWLCSQPDLNWLTPLNPINQRTLADGCRYYERLA